MPAGTRLMRISAIDPDEGEAGEVRYYLERPSVSKPKYLYSDNTIEGFVKTPDQFDLEDATRVFMIDEMTGDIRLQRRLDFETMQFYNFTIIARNNGQRPMSSSAVVLMEIEDVDENYYAPKFEHDIVTTASVAENSPLGTFVTRIVATDADDPTVPVVLQIVSGTGLGRFHIDPNSGNITTACILDAEAVGHYWLTIAARDRAVVPRTSYLEVLVSIEDVNDMPPVTIEPVYTVSLYENVTIGTEVLRLQAIDHDRSFRDKQPTVMFRILNDVPFAINASSGLIQTTKALDAENTSRYIFDVEVSEVRPVRNQTIQNKDQVLKSRTPVVVRLLDVNEFQPKSIRHTYHCNIFTHVNQSLPVCNVLARDQDVMEPGSGCSITYKIVAGNDENLFRINAATGFIYATTDRLEKGDHALRVQIGDCDHDEKQEKLHTTTVVILRVHQPKNQDNEKVPNRPPRVDEYEAMVTVSQNEQVGHMVAMIPVLDDDLGDRIYSAIVRGNVDDTFIFLENGALMLAKPLGRNSFSQFNLTIMATDGMSNMNFDVVVNVVADYDNFLAFTAANYTINVLENITVGTEIVQMSVVANEYSLIEKVFGIYSSRDPATKSIFEIEANNGKIKLRQELDFETGLKQHSMLIEVSDARAHHGLFNRRAFALVIINVIDVNDVPPRFVMSLFRGTILNTAAVGSSIVQVPAYDHDLGANGELSYSIDAGNINETFAIEPTFAYIYTTRSLLDVRQNEFFLKLRVTDNGRPRRTSTAAIHIHIEQPQTTPTTFRQHYYLVNVLEDEMINRVIMAPNVISHHPTFYQITKGDDRAVFGINVNTGEVYLRTKLDYEQAKNYTLTIAATNQVGHVDTATLVVNIIDTNDNEPRWTRPEFYGVLYEQGDEPQPKGKKTKPFEPKPQRLRERDTGQALVVTAHDDDSAHNAVLFYSIVEHTAREYFHIEPHTGALKLVKHFNCDDYRGDERHYNFSVSVVDYGQPRLKAKEDAIVQVQCADTDRVQRRCPPEFEHPVYKVRIYLPITANVIVAQLSATDCQYRFDKLEASSRDRPLVKPQYVFNITKCTRVDDNVGEECSSLFEMNTESGMLLTRSSAFPTGDFRLEVAAFNDDGEAGRAEVHVQATPYVSNGLRFTQDVFNISFSEGLHQMAKLMVLPVEGAKLGENLKYRIMTPNKHFLITNTIGALLYRGQPPFDREEVDRFELLIEVISATNEHRIAFTKVNIVLEDENDNQPIFLGVPYRFIVNRELVATTSTDGEVGRVYAIDADDHANGQVRYSIKSGNHENVFMIDASTGIVRLRPPFREYDQSEEIDSYSLTVAATDHGKFTLANILAKTN